MTCYKRTRQSAARANYYPLFANIVNEIFDSTKNEKTPTRPNMKFNVREYDDRFVIQIALPGYSKNQVAIDLDNDLLTVKDISDQKAQTTTFRLREFNYSGFKKSFYLPETVDREQITASYNAGVLALSLYKKKEAIPQPPKSIEIA